MNKHITTDNLKTIFPPIQYLIDQKAENLDWNENDPSSKGYIKNRPFYTYEKVIEGKYLVQETTFTGVTQEETPVYSTELPYNSDVIDEVAATPEDWMSTTFNVLYDGVTYQASGKIFEGNGMPYIGNLYILIGEESVNTEEPFAFVVNGIVAVLDGNEHTISIQLPDSYETTDVKIDAKYLPEVGLGRKGIGENAEVYNNGGAIQATGAYSHAEGVKSVASGNYSHAEGLSSIAGEQSAHAEGTKTQALGIESHAEGQETIASGLASHAEGSKTKALDYYTHAEGYQTEASGSTSHAEGYRTKATGEDSHAEGANSTASGKYSHVEGAGSTASGEYSHAEGWSSQASGESSHTEGYHTIASGYNSHAEGNNTEASGSCSHAEGYETDALGEDSHAEGNNTEASGKGSHAEGFGSRATGNYSHAEGSSFASGEYSHAEGDFNHAVGRMSHSEGYGTNANNYLSHTEGYYTVASSNYQHVQGKYNIEDAEGKYAHIVGNGYSINDIVERSNAHTLDWNGIGWFANLKVGGTSQEDPKANEVATQKDINLAKNYIALKDEVNGLTYLISMRNGSLVSSYATISITINSLPNKTEYIAGEYFDPTGMVIMANLGDGSIKEITKYSFQTDYLTEEDTEIQIIYLEAGIKHIANIPISVTPFNPEIVLKDFTYNIIDNGTYSISGWKGTYNGEPSTEVIVPNNGLIHVI